MYMSKLQSIQITLSVLHDSISTHKNNSRESPYPPIIPFGQTVKIEIVWKIIPVCTIKTL